MAFCTNCGEKIADGVRFCPQCGAKIEPDIKPEAEMQEAEVQQVAEPECVAEQPAPASTARYFGEDGIEVVPYVPVAAPVTAAPAQAEASVEGPAAAAQAAPAAKPAKTPKKGIAKALPFIIIGAVVLLGALIGAVALVIAVLEHGFGLPDKNMDPNLGVYQAVQAQVWGAEVAVEDIWADGVTIELREKGKCVVLLNGDESKGKWMLEDDILTVKSGALDCIGTLEGGEMQLENVMGMGVVLTLQNQDLYAELPSVDIDDPGVPADDGPETEMQERWNGTWYGVVNFMECTGQYAAQDYMQYDAYMTVELGQDDTGMATIWLDPSLPPFAVAHVQAESYGLRATDGQVLTTHMNTDNWTFVLAPDSEMRYVMPYDRVEDHDGDAFEYVIFMKKWGESWAEEMEFGEIVPPYVEAYEEHIANGDQPPVLDPDAAPAEELYEAIPGAEAMAPAELAVPSNWYGWVQFTNWWGNDEPDGLIDAWGTLAMDGDRPYFEIYVDNVDTAFYSVYLELTEDNTTIRPVVDGGDAWVGDYYMEPGDEDKYSLHSMSDGTLCAEFAFVGASGEYGCDVMICFREHGQLWDEYEDQLPPRYDEYLDILAEEAAQQEAYANEEPADLPEGDGYMTYNQLKESFAWLDEYGSDATLEEVVEHFGVPGAQRYDEEDFRSYRWQTADDSASVAVSFVPKDGQWVYNGMSWTGDLDE